METLDRQRFPSLTLRRVAFLKHSEELERLNESEGSFWREMEGRVSEEEEAAAMVESEREEGVRRIVGWWRRECMYRSTVCVCVEWAVVL
jgi:hypothetical protein